MNTVTTAAWWNEIVEDFAVYYDLLRQRRLTEHDYGFVLSLWARARVEDYPAEFAVLRQHMLDSLSSAQLALDAIMRDEFGETAAAFESALDYAQRVLQASVAEA